MKQFAIQLSCRHLVRLLCALLIALSLALRVSIRRVMPKSKAAKRPKTLPFEYDRGDHGDCREDPSRYRIGKPGSEQGVLMVQPYKSELLPHWKFAQPADARKSSAKLEEMFKSYRDEGDFVGCDMAQMGFTRARRYANHAGGRKYTKDEHGNKTELPRGPEDPVKAESASIFAEVLARVKADETYQRMMEEHRKLEWATYEAQQVKQESDEDPPKRKPRVKAVED